MGTTLHKKMGNVHVGLAIAFLVGSGLGVIGGGKLNGVLFNYNPVMSDLVISAVPTVVAVCLRLVQNCLKLWTLSLGH